MTDPLFQVKNLRVSYPQRRGSTAEAIDWAVDDVSFTLNPGDRLGLVGESGCGKSTLGRAAMRLLSAETRIEGDVTFDGRSVFGLSESALRRFRGEAVALIFQDPMTRLDPLMTIGDHCLETLRAHRPQMSRRQAKDRAIATLEAVNIPARRWAQYPHEFSGGMRQRVAIALALLLDPKLIVADEPTTSLDVTISAQILQELTRLCADREMALLLISHDLAMVGEYCDRIAVMYQGKFVETGSTADVFRDPQHRYTRSLLQAALHLQAQAQKTKEVEAETGAIAPLLQLRNLQRHYSLGDGLLGRLLGGQAAQTIRAVDDVSLALYAGETLGLVGESGCGKSTLSRTILQLVQPTGGTVEFLGRNITRLSRRDLQQQRRQMQMVFQDPHACLNPMMTVGESIADPLLIHRLATRETARSQVMQMLERVWVDSNRRVLFALSVGAFGRATAAGSDRPGLDHPAATADLR